MNSIKEASCSTLLTWELIYREKTRQERETIRLATYTGEADYHDHLLNAETYEAMTRHLAHLLAKRLQEDSDSSSMTSNDRNTEGALS